MIAFWLRARAAMSQRRRAYCQQTRRSSTGFNRGTLGCLRTLPVAVTQQLIGTQRHLWLSANLGNFEEIRHIFCAPRSVLAVISTIFWSGLVENQQVTNGAKDQHKGRANERSADRCSSNNRLAIARA